jgi:hypothetical protein
LVLGEAVAVFSRAVAKLLQLQLGRWSASADAAFNLAFGGRFSIRFSAGRYAL